MMKAEEMVDDFLLGQVAKNNIASLPLFCYTIPIPLDIPRYISRDEGKKLQDVVFSCRGGQLFFGLRSKKYKY